VLDALLAKRCPKAMAQLARLETPLEEVTGPWFHSLFCTSLPAETAARIWDVLLLEGHKILFRVGLALFKVRVFLKTIFKNVIEQPWAAQQALFLVPQL
jgi:hypothetical protein